jgi:hypothetical protein
MSFVVFNTTTYNINLNLASKRALFFRFSVLPRSFCLFIVSGSFFPVFFSFVFLFALCCFIFTLGRVSFLCLLLVFFSRSFVCAVFFFWFGFSVVFLFRSRFPLFPRCLRLVLVFYLLFRADVFVSYSFCLFAFALFPTSALGVPCVCDSACCPRGGFCFVLVLCVCVFLF